jgi:hypothetical protein
LRRLSPTIVLALTAGVIAGCGGHGATGTTAATRTGKPAKPSTSQDSSPGARARAVAFARAVNLRASDVPGLRVSHRKPKHSASERETERRLERCVGISSSDQLLEAGSSDFERTGGISQFSVSSNVSVSRSATIAHRELARLRGSHARACLQHYLALLLRGPSFRGAAVGPVRVQEGTPPATGANGSVGMRISTSITVRRIPIPFYMDILGFVYGPAEVSLMSTGVPIPFPAPTQQRLFLALLARAVTRHP